MMTLKLNIETREDHQAKIVAEFEPAELTQYKGRAARKIASKAKIPGFRPGKAPYDVIARLYGEPAIEDEAIELMMDAVYPEILVEAKIEPAAPGTLENVEKGDPLVFTFMIPLEPTVNLENYLAIRKPYNPEDVTDKQVDEFITRLRRTYATAEPVERPAEIGDLVYAMVNATLLKPGDDDQPELLKDTPIQLVIGEGDNEINAYPYPGFGDNLVGLAANDTKQFNYTYPKDSPYERLRGKAVEFNVLVQNIKKLTLPEVSEEFAKTLGEFASVDELKEAVKKQLQDQQTAEYDEKYYDELLDEVVQGATIKYPPQVLDHEIEHLVEKITHDLSHQKMELDVYLKTINKEKDAWLEEEVKPSAIKNLLRSLVVNQLSKSEAVKINNEAVQAEVTGILSQLQQSAGPKELEKQLKNKSYLNGITYEAASRAMSKRVFAYLRDIATDNLEKPENTEEKADSTPVKKAKKTVKKTDTGEKPEELNDTAPVKKTRKTTAANQEEEK